MFLFTYPLVLTCVSGAQRTFLIWKSDDSLHYRPHKSKTIRASTQENRSSGLGQGKPQFISLLKTKGNILYRQQDLNSRMCWLVCPLFVHNNEIRFSHEEAHNSKTFQGTDKNMF